MNNEPYGWHCFDDDNDFLLMNGKGFSKPDSSWNKVIPLYTHPAKTLTDEEMELAYYECFGLKNKMPDNEKRRSYFKFARAILKKASEK